MIQYEINRIKKEKIHILEKVKHIGGTNEMRKEINKLQTNVGAILIARKNQNKFRTKKQNNNAHVGAGPVSAQNAITLIALVITILFSYDEK